jgi:hypothetical protein
VEKITENTSSKKSEISRILSIISIIICLIGGIAFIWFGIVNNGDYGYLLIVLGIFAIIGAIIRLIYPRRGSIFCLGIGIIGLLVAWALEYSAIYGTILTLIGSVIGFIGVMKE